MATWDQKEQVKSPRCEDEEARLCRSAETAADRQSTPPPHHRGCLKGGSGHQRPERGLHCRAAKEVSPLVVANNRPLSQVQQQQV